jgi:hypothetical protein
MSIQFYKPNSKNTGSAFTFSLSQDKNNAPSFYISSIAQHGWNDSKKTGSFSGNAKNPEKIINTKINHNEAGEFLNAINNRTQFSSFHSYGDNTTTIKLTPWDKNAKVSNYNPSSKSFEESNVVVPCFGFSLSKNKSVNIKIALEPGELEVLKRVLIKYIDSYINHQINSSQNYQSDSSPKSEITEQNPF